MGVDEKSGVLVYNFFITHRVSDNKSFKESYYFSYFLGDYDVWDRYIKNIEKNKFISATSSLWFNLIGAALTLPFSPILAVIASAAFAGISFSSSSKKSFAAASRAVLNTALKYANRYDVSFGCMDIITYSKSGFGYYDTITLYLGDKSIYVI